jgi:hypothetical protein
MWCRGGVAAFSIIMRCMRSEGSWEKMQDSPAKQLPLRKYLFHESKGTKMAVVELTCKELY